MRSVSMPRSLLFAGVTAIGSLAALGSTGCNAYDPDLGQAPFRCGETEPRCPLDYICVNYSSSEQICELDESAGSGGSPDGGSSGTFTCANDSAIEPNNSTADATNTFIPANQTTYSLSGGAICPGTDQDFFVFANQAQGSGASADVTFDPSRGTLAVELLNGTGALIATGQLVSGQTNVVRVGATNLATGPYFIKVSSPNGTEDNYSLQLSLAAP